jgi:hypothetical protein
MSNPLITSTTVTGSSDGTWQPGDEVVAVDSVMIDGVEIHVPKTLPGVVEYASVANLEAQANTLRPMLLQNLDKTGALPYQSDADLAFSFFGAAASTAGTAIAGLEAFANYHITRFVPPPEYDSSGQVVEAVPTIEHGGEALTFMDLANQPLNERYSKDHRPDSVRAFCGHDQNSVRLPENESPA